MPYKDPEKKREASARYKLKEKIRKYGTDSGDMRGKIHTGTHNRPCLNTHKSYGGFVLVRDKNTHFWLVMKPPINSLDKNWIEEIGLTYKNWELAQDALNKLQFPHPNTPHRYIRHNKWVLDVEEQSKFPTIVGWATDGKYRIK